MFILQTFSYNLWKFVTKTSASGSRGATHRPQYPDPTGINFQNPVAIFSFFYRYCNQIVKERHNQCCWSGSVMDPYSEASWIQIRIRQSWARDNETMFSGHNVVCNCHFTMFVVATPSRHWGLTIYRIFSGPWGSFTLLRYGVVVVVKLKYCQVPSSGIRNTDPHMQI